LQKLTEQNSWKQEMFDKVSYDKPTMHLAQTVNVHRDYHRNFLPPTRLGSVGLLYPVRSHPSPSLVTRKP